MMADNWDDILAEPIASIGDPVAAGSRTIGQSGKDAQPWLAVESLSDISPRPQDAPVTMPDATDMLQLKLTLQAETQEPSAKLPPSLAEQLSLTWAARKRHRIDAEAEPEAEPAAPTPRRAVPPAAAPSNVEPPKPVAAWRKPFEAVARVFTRQPQPEPEAAPPSVETLAPPAPAPQPRTVLAIAEPPVADQTPAPRASLPEVPLTLAAPQRRADTPETAPNAAPAPRPETNAPLPPVAPAAPRDLPLAETPVVRAARSEQVDAPARRVDAPVQDTTDAPSVTETRAPQSLAPRRGLLAWLLPRRAPETPQPPQPPTPRTSAPVAREAAPRLAEPRSKAPQNEHEPTLAETLPALRSTAPQVQDETFEPDLTPATMQDLPPEVALTHLLRTPREDAPSDADAETVRETLSRIVDAAPATQPARVDTAGDQGETLPAVLMERMEGLLDVPLHEVRIFRGQVSQRLTERMQADAVTIGNQVHVAPGQADPSLPSGRALLAHEVTHYAVHRVESEGPAATLSGSPSAGEPTWPQFTGIAPEPGAPSHEAEETLALRIEHAMSRPEAPDLASPTPAPVASPPSLQHRAPPPQIVVAPGGMPGVPLGGDAGGIGAFGGFSAGAFGGGPIGGGFAGGMSSNGGGVGMAPWDRIVGGAEDVMSTASGMAGQAGEMAQEVQEAAEDFEDNDEMIEKVADAVLKRMEDKDKFERERRGAFDGSIGG